MKKKGNVCDYIVDRNAELVSNFKRHVRESKIIDLDVIFRKVSQSPASRFFVSEQRACNVLLQKRKTGKWNIRAGQRLKMFQEIDARVEALLKEDPALDFEDAVYEAVNSEAPGFYLTPRSCRTLIYNVLKKS